MASGTPPPKPANFDEITSLGKYKIQKKIGAGGMGAVYLATDQQLKRTVALKVLPKDKADNKTLVRRFKAEGQAGAQLEHPNIVSVYESGEIDGYLYLAMEYVEGVDAYELLKKRGVLPAKRSLDIIKQVVQALDHAYERSVVHRDIKPSNLLIRERDGLVKLADMGLARVIEDDGESGITKAGTTVGTVDYMSPEQARDSKQADTRSDIYSLGCTWYHLVAGKAPYPDGDLMNKLRAHAMQPVPDPRDWNENVPAGIVAVIQRMMAKKPDDRYQTPKQLLADLNSPTLLRSDFSADQLSMLAAAHVGASSPQKDEEDEIEESTPAARVAKRKSDPAKTGPQNRVRVEREESEPEADDVPSTPSKIKKAKVPEKPAGKRTGARETLPPRASTENIAAAETEGGGGKKAKSERALPGRIDQPLLSDQPSRQIDPNTIKLILFILIVVLGIGGVFYGIKQFSQSDVGGGGIANPYAKGDVSKELPTVAPASVVGQSTVPGTTTPIPNSGPIPSVPQVIATNASVPVDSALPVNSQIDTTPFGGVALTGSSLPGWISESRIEPSQLPPQTVRLHDPGKQEFSSFSQVMASARGDTLIELADAGPHDLPVLDKKSHGRWIIRGAKGITPVLVVREGAIQVRQGTLDLEGVHLILTSDKPDLGLRVGPGTLVIRDSTLTHLASRGEGLIVSDANGKVVLEDSLLRTQGTCPPVVLRGPQSGLAVGHSVIIAGNARAIQFTSKDGANDSRQVMLTRSAVFSGQAGISFIHEGKQPPPVDLQLRQSLISYLPGHNADAVGMDFQGWTRGTDVLDKPRVSGVNWKSERSAWIGWPHWVTLGYADKSAAVDVRDETEWKAFWRTPTAPGELIPEGVSLQLAANAAALVTAEQLESGLAGAGSQINEVGPKWTELPKPPQSILTNLLAFDRKVQLPAGMVDPDPGQQLRFDLKKPTLGRYLNSEEVPDGSTVVAFGSGLRTIDPFVLKQKRLQLVFEQTEGTLLVVQPGYKTEPGAMRPAAWIGVEDGQLTIENGFFRMVSGNRNYPDRFLQMAGGLAVVRRIRVEGVESTFPLVDLTPSAGHAPPQLLIDRSILAAMRSVIRVGAAESVLELRQSVISSAGGTALIWDTGSTKCETIINHSTLAGQKSVYQLMPLGGTNPVELFSEGAVYQGGSIMSLETDASSISWWGRRNAYSSDTKTFLLTAGAAPAPQDFQARWVQGWGAGHELNPVQGTNSTLLPQLPATVVDTLPESFRLHDDCAAAKAGLGAPISQVGPNRTAPKPAAATPDVKPKVNPQKPVSPGF